MLFSDREIQAGTEVLWSYGEKRDTELYISYRFYIKDIIDESCLEVKVQRKNYVSSSLKYMRSIRTSIYDKEVLDLPILEN